MSGWRWFAAVVSLAQVLAEAGEGGPRTLATLALPTIASVDGQPQCSLGLSFEDDGSCTVRLASGSNSISAVIEP
jgi:hypothetical protein